MENILRWKNSCFYKTQKEFLHISLKCQYAGDIKLLYYYCKSTTDFFYTIIVPEKKITTQKTLKKTNNGRLSYLLDILWVLPGDYLC